MFKDYLCKYRFGWALKGWSAPGANDATATKSIADEVEENLAKWAAEWAAKKEGVTT